MKSNIMRLWAFAALVFFSLSFVSAVVVITPPIVTTTTVVINQSIISSYNITYQNFAYNQSHWNLSGSNLFTKDTVWRVAIGGNSATSTLTVTGNVSISGNTSIDGSTFFVDTDNNRVGIGTTTSVDKFEVAGALHTSGAAVASKASEAYWDFFNGGTRFTALGADTSTYATMKLISAKSNGGDRVLFQGYTTGDTSLADDRLYVQYSTSNVGIGTTDPSAARLVIDTGSNTAGLRLLGTAETAEIADLYVDSGGQLIISNTAGTDTAGWIDMRSEDNEYGILIRESDGTGTDAFLNIFVVDTTTDYANLVMDDTGAMAGLVIQQGGNVGIGEISPLYPLTIKAAGNATNITVWASGNFSGTGYITRTYIWDDKKGSALNYFQDVSKFKKANGEINHSAYQIGYVSYPNQRQNGTYEKSIIEQKENITTIITVVNGTNETEQIISYYNITTINTLPTYEIFMEEGVMLDAVVAKHEQAVYELIEENKLLKARIVAMESIIHGTNGTQIITDVQPANTQWWEFWK